MCCILQALPRSMLGQHWADMSLWAALTSLHDLYYYDVSVPNAVMTNGRSHGSLPAVQPCGQPLTLLLQTCR